MINKNSKIGENCTEIELDIEGMDCPACALKIEKRVSKLESVQSVKVNLGSETATILFTGKSPELNKIKSEIDSLGYKAIEPDTDEAEEEAETEKLLNIRKLRNKIIVSIILSALIMLLGMKEHLGILDSLSMNIANWISLPLSTIVVFWC